MEIYVCIGSSCHLKGSYDIITLMKEHIKEHHLEDKIEMKASFCLESVPMASALKWTTKL